MSNNVTYQDLNASLNILGSDGKIQFDKDKEAARAYFIEDVNQNTVFFHSLEEKLNYLFKEGYYKKEVFDQYKSTFVKNLYKHAYKKKFRFETYMGAFKFYSSYAMKTTDGKRFLERYEDRIVAVSLTLAKGNESLATTLVDEIMSGRFQPATPTFLNAGKVRAGEQVSCFVAGTKVRTKTGNKSIEHIEVGDLVVTHSGGLKPVETVIENDYNGAAVEILTVGRGSFVATEEHPILVVNSDVKRIIHELNGVDGSTENVSWVAAKNVKHGDYVVVAKPQLPKNKGDGDKFSISNIDKIAAEDLFEVIHHTSIKDLSIEDDKIVKLNKDEKTIDGYTVYRVSGIRNLEINEKVYNLHVAEEHTYTVSNGVVVHNCFLMRLEDNMESISRAVNGALQLSKRGGGVALLLSNLREAGAPIKGMENQSTGVIPVMKILEDSFSYANQLGARQGAGAVYLNAHHPDIMKFLDTKRENADEKIRIKTLSLGVVIPDITFELAKNNEPMYLFSPYDVERVYGMPFSEVSISEKYREMVDNPKIKKTKIQPRDLFQTIAELQFESGYPYILFEDTASRANIGNGRINMSNLCVDGVAEFEISSDPEGNNTSFINFFELSEMLKGGLSHNIWVKSFNEGVTWERVTGVHGKGFVEELYELEYNGKTVRVTQDHEIFTHNRGWVKAKDLLETDILEYI